MYVTKHIDWLSCTFEEGTDIQRIFSQLEWRYCGRGNFGYRYAYRDKITGATYQERSADPTMGVHLQLSGNALNSLRTHYERGDDDIVRTVSDWNCHASRVDLTINIHEGGLTPRKVYQAAKSGKLTAKTRSYRFIEGKNGDISGDTFYMGSPQSDRQFRCYDKNAERGVVDSSAWVRLELELRSLRADAAFSSCVDNGVSEAVTGHMADFLHWDNSEFAAAIASPSARPYQLPRKDTNRQRWLLGQVAQALAKEMLSDVEFKDKFDFAVLSFLDNMRDG